MFSFSSWRLFIGNYPPVSFGYEDGVEPRAGRRDKNPYLCRHSKFSHQPILQFQLALLANACISTLVTLSIQDRLQFMLRRLVSVTVVPQRTGNLVPCASYSTRGLWWLYVLHRYEEEAFRMHRKCEA